MNMTQTFQICKKYMRNYKFLDVKMILNCRKINRLFYSSQDSLRANEGKSRNLYQHLYSRILACGPITVADYMKEILTHPSAGYYINKDVFGERGDFTTSPEITQLFGEMIAVWILYEKTKISKGPFQIIELGPGRGTLIKDILRVFKQLHILNDISVHLVEISPALSLIQAKNLCKTIKEHDTKTNESEQNSITYYREGVTEDGVNIYWYHSIMDVPRKFSIFLANEFFDALPIHKFQKTDRGWNEVLVDIIEGSSEEKFRYVLSNKPSPATLYISDDEKRDHVEISPQSLLVVDYIAQYLSECGGCALISDYGHNGDKTDTFRAFSQHKMHDPLSRPGTADLTADVDFAALMKIAIKNNYVITFGPVTQSNFLKSLGIDVRLKLLLKNASKEQRERLESEYRMIMDEDKMGTRFKFLSLFPSILKNHLQRLPVTGFSSK
ncbi:protein arginine methyltransferase NDUFAF7, mitochondrial isoform X1 [Hylaeus anthracinus]|uniref:protein arginine methyltransferase NDUFAF7, mitochondrial isoform X1 n=1 Tax=Hylaeus anthracinus TaxID=313031 RepID=UPI0023BA3001|nr:protein arginine methyltransferase NDUFAF7, mitochondrial isoform X1 [Hylaeus anthracinus]XP_053999659.1 protein arginine methyltransferase NDUFAF7, mitochondrial isoform X1 [Hylaeus anthracinus]